MVDAAPRLVELGRPIRVVHQTGERDVEMVRAGYAAAGLEAQVEPFIYDMGVRLAQADLVICRAGATTLAELTAAGKPAVLIPLPTATDDHQRKNAEALAAAGAAEMLLQSDATGMRLATVVGDLVRDEQKRARMSAAARSMARPDAARMIVDEALALAGVDRDK
ncbi:MAG: UDP-N-acetylglucosamine--N-acetylmuramyl-(pentapeptide) pyrophosphoryl-undecaprenol N-acetylglucosamine transferase [Vicinamibacterales bacterium]